MSRDRSERAKHIAEAFIKISAANHYMVGFIDLTSDEDELELAKQILIIRSNDLEGKNEVTERALDLIEQEIKGSKL